MQNLELGYILINEKNKNTRLGDLKYFDQSKLTEKVKVENLLSDSIVKEYGIFCLPILMVNPHYWTDSYIELINENNIESLIFSIFATGFLFKPNIEASTLKSLDFLARTPSIKQIYIQQQKDIMFLEPDFFDINDFSPIEELLNLECINISNNETYVNIDFSKLHFLRTVNAQFLENNKSLYSCINLEQLYSRYYEENLLPIKKLTKLISLELYAENLRSLRGLEFLSNLKTLKLDLTSKFKSFEIVSSNTLETLSLYDGKSIKSLKSLSNLKNIKRINFTNFKKLESVKDLNKCSNIEHITFVDCKIPNDINELGSLKKLKTLTINDCKNIESLSFVKEIQELKVLSFDGNTKVIDGSLNFLKELYAKGVNIVFNDRKHYSLKWKDLSLND